MNIYKKYWHYIGYLKQQGSPECGIYKFTLIGLVKLALKQTTKFPNVLIFLFYTIYLLIQIKNTTIYSGIDLYK